MSLWQRLIGWNPNESKGHNWAGMIADMFAPGTHAYLSKKNHWDTGQPYQAPQAPTQGGLSAYSQNQYPPNTSDWVNSWVNQDYGPNVPGLQNVLNNSNNAQVFGYGPYAHPAQNIYGVLGNPNGGSGHFSNTAGTALSGEAAANWVQGMGQAYEAGIPDQINRVFGTTNLQR